MASRFALIVLVCVASMAIARPQANQRQQHGENGSLQGGKGGHGGPHGPLGAVFDKLTDAQKQELQQISQEQTLTKAQIKQKLEAFEQDLSSDLQTLITNDKQEHDAKKTQFETQNQAAVGALSANAQTVYQQIKAIKDNENITPEQERDQIKAIIDGADASVKTELENAHLLGHGHGPHGGKNSDEKDNQKAQ
ncbi:Brugia malayi antigen [Aphelenchoides avenae]|nr:Brugia malayi antigen [Aphelenchus avenae]